MGSGKRSVAQQQRRAKILRYWRAVEYFSPQTVDKVNPRERMFGVGPNRPLPWEPGSALDRHRPRRGFVWQHTVYAGIFAVDKVRDVLLQAFRAPDSEQNLDGRVGGDSAMLCFTVNQDGVLLKDSVTLSACAWAVSQTLRPGPHSDRWLTGFDQEASRLLQQLLDLGDGKVEVDRRPAGRSAQQGSGLGPVAGLMSRLVTSAARGGLGAAAGAVGASIGPVAGPVAGTVAAKVIEGVGGEVIDYAAERITDHVSGGDTASDSGADDPKQPAATTGPPPQVGTKVLDVYDLAAITRWVAEQLGVGEILQPDAIRVKSYQVSARHADEAGGDGFLNSFYADDLERVAEALDAGQAGTALLDYLRDEADLDAMDRFDLRRMPEVVLASVQPSDMPLGRWPTDTDKPLAVSQQFAVNRILATLGNDAGIYAVNGPPGTGKTTMLRDLIAALVVQRAERLAALKRPEDAFARTPLTWRTEETAGRTFPHAIRPLIPELTGFEIVIASSNNGAVENVTLEVPGARAIGDAWRERADYLAGPASLALDAEAWGAIAARLGRRSYRSDFVERFWWGNPHRDKSRSRPAAEDSDRIRGLHELLQTQDRRPRGGRAGAGAVTDPDTAAPLGRQTWAQAVERFTRARDRVASLAAERQEIADLQGRIDGPDTILDELLAQESSARDMVLRIQQERRKAQAELADRHAEHARRRDAMFAERTRLGQAEIAVVHGQDGVRAAEAALHAYGADKPGMIRRLFTREPMRRWEAGLRPFQSALETADARLAELESQRALQHAAVRAAQEDLDRALAAVRHAEDRLSAYERACAQQVATIAEAGQQVARRRREREAEQRRLRSATQRWGRSVPGAEWRADPADDHAMQTRELSAPWMDAAFAEARSELFLAALDLHRALLANAPALMRRNLLAAMDVVKGQAPAELDAATVLAAWQMLFLVVPVVSTTFASIGRMFAQLGSEALGWLFVDEAGQAAAHEVVGALWRTRRAVIVGDPLQLEPVVTLPWTGQRRLASHFAVDRQWAPSAASVQTLADRLNPYGTWIDRHGEGSTGESIWVGSPLRVHRRCDRLMFDVSNAIAYDGLMVYGVHRNQDDFALVERSVWWDVCALPGDEKWNPEEGAALRETLDRIGARIDQAIERERMQDDGAFRDEPDADRAAERARRLNDAVFVISPFRDVVHGLSKVVNNTLNHKRYGTVHTTQGKEADIVILVLGTGAGQVGSRDWAAQRPNLLNVAVTRARRRLIVIGDFDAWSRHKNFTDLAHHELLHRWTPKR